MLTYECRILIGTYYGNSKYKRFRFSCNATLQHGLNSIALLSVAVGLPVSFLENSSISLQDFEAFFSTNVIVTLARILDSTMKQGTQES